MSLRPTREQEIRAEERVKRLKLMSEMMEAYAKSQPNRGEIRKKAWDEIQRRDYTDEQHRCFMAGMFVMWRLCGLDNQPLFTFDPDGTPCELEETTSSEESD
jgi:hypothetical protein